MNIMPPRCTHTKLADISCGNNRWLECNDCGAKFYCRSKDKLINNEDMYDRLCAQEREIRIMREQVLKLSKKLDEIYYAPGMPGYISVKNDFENISK